MMDLYVPELLKESGLFAIWVTNNTKYFKFIDDMIEYFGFEKIATWRWLKVNFTANTFHISYPVSLLKSSFGSDLTWLLVF